MQVFVSRPSCWAPGLSSAEDWAAWAEGRKCPDSSDEAPALTFTTPLFRRRLSQLSRMTVQVVHDALAQTACGDIPLVFVSLRGELRREFTVNEKLIKEGDVSPAAFSLSVFNAPVALATIACKLRSGYSVVTPAGGCFAHGFAAACAPVLCGSARQVLFVYGDELVPETYGSLRPERNEPFAFAAVLSAEPGSCAGAGIPFADVRIGSPETSCPEALLRHLLKETRG